MERDSAHQLGFSYVYVHGQHLTTVVAKLCRVVVRLTGSSPATWTKAGITLGSPSADSERPHPIRPRSRRYHCQSQECLKTEARVVSKLVN